MVFWYLKEFRFTCGPTYHSVGPWGLWILETSKNIWFFGPLSILKANFYNLCEFKHVLTLSRISSEVVYV